MQHKLSCCGVQVLLSTAAATLALNPHAHPGAAPVMLQQGEPPGYAQQLSNQQVHCKMTAELRPALLVTDMLVPPPVTGSAA